MSSSSCSKRKLSITDSDYVDDSCSHSKRRRVDQITPPNPTITVPPLTSQNAVHNEDGIEAIPEMMVEQVEKLKEELKEVRERLARVEQESTCKSNVLSRVVDMTDCSICKEPIHNPYTLECGHSACCRCLRKWWLTSESGAEVHHNPIVEVSTDESENEEHGASTSTTLQGPQHRYPADSHVRSVLHSTKHCPECRQIMTRCPVPDYRLRDIVDALRSSPLSSMAQMKRDERWGRCRRQDVWRGIFPSSGDGIGDGSAIRSAQTQQAYILPSVAQGRIETPLPSFFHSRHGIEQHRTERRSQPYNIAHPQRRERRRWEPYNPVREAPREMEEQRERQRQRHSHSRSPAEHARVRLNRELSPDGGLEPESTLLGLSFLDIPSLDIPHRYLEPPRELELATLETSSLSQSPPLRPPIVFPRPQSQLNPRPQLPPLRELLSLPFPSDVSLPPLFNDLPTALEISPSTSQQHNPCLSDNGVEANDSEGREKGAHEEQNEEGIDNGADTSNSSETAGDAWIGADLED